MCRGHEVTWQAAVRRRVDGTHVVDPWGLDADVDALAASLLAGLPLHVDGEVPDGAVLVVTRRRLRVALGLLRATGRPPRVLGIPDVEPVASAVRRIGGAVDHPAEAAGLLRAGHLVVARHDAAVMAAAERVGAAVVEAVTAGRFVPGASAFTVVSLRSRSVTPLPAAATRRGGMTCASATAG
jgi:hypothetical protein